MHILIIYVFDKVFDKVFIFWVYVHFLKIMFNMFSDLPSEVKNDFKNPKYSFTQPIIYDASTEHSNTGWVDVQTVTLTKY